ncbi:putative 26S protease regulatory subunit-like protein [Colletotrichum higginsianum]|nr:putative 26S protease regulatory subunit-like protein [Colletotrichum higginsianum]
MRRGQTFWKCREKRLISYQGTGQIYSGERFMIDFETYTSFHPDNQYTNKEKFVPEPGLPTDGSEPHVPEIYLFSNLVPGFDLRRKKWVDVEVDQIRDVAWNDHAFNSLVADEDMKMLILALVTNQIDAKRGTDVIDNKGNGLIMLLHGSPGTGKTFTAESVAEIAKKPLYSVTCGDIGTNPADVEKYLESVFHLGKIWDCVVLLDEAEVFLEQRTLQDLQRNALVSVFLRALEYYDGILILTTNRVGTFDEAFKSRIQLALQYKKLEAYQRKQIWKNFFERLKSIGEEDSIDFDDISLHIDELTKHPMNGRQIRNTITTARQLAKFMGNKMVFSHLQRTIAITNKFDEYLADVREADVEEHGGRGLDGRYSDEYFARSDQIR